jgi:hypothetical protein
MSHFVIIVTLLCGTYVNHEKLRLFEPAGRLAELVVYIYLHSQKKIKKKNFLTSIAQFSHCACRELIVIN